MRKCPLRCNAIRPRSSVFIETVRWRRGELHSHRRMASASDPHRSRPPGAGKRALAEAHQPKCHQESMSGSPMKFGRMKVRMRALVSPGASCLEGASKEFVPESRGGTERELWAISWSHLGGRDDANRCPCLPPASACRGRRRAPSARYAARFGEQTREGAAASMLRVVGRALRSSPPARGNWRAIYAIRCSDLGG